MNKKENSFLDELSEERRHNLTANEEQLDAEREDRFEDIHRKYPDFYKDLDEMISKPIVREVMREVVTSKRQTIREWRQFEILAVEPVYYKTKFAWEGGKRYICKRSEQSRWLDHERVVIRDVENGSRWVLIVAHAYNPNLIYGIEDCRSMIEASMFFGYIGSDSEYCLASDAIGDLIKLPTRNGQPDFPIVTDEAQKRLQTEMNGKGVAK